MTDKNRSTPMLDQYRRLKRQHPDALLLFRLGDFYELFEADAVRAAPLLDVQLTSRDGVVPMCGIPHHALHQYLPKLMAAGLSAAIAEQVEDPKAAKGLVDRQIVRVVSPGTYVPEEGNRTPRLAVLFGDRLGWALAVAELSTGSVMVTEGALADRQTLLEEEWARWSPDEYLTNLPLNLSGRRVPDGPWFRIDTARLEADLAAKLGTASLSSWGLADKPRIQSALAVLWRYVTHSQYREPVHLRQIVYYPLHQGMRVSPRTLAQLDVMHDTHPSLYSVLNLTVTPMGARELARWLERPLTDLPAIRRRNQAISAWMDEPAARDRLRHLLREVGDLSRRLSRLALGMGQPRDLGGVRRALDRMPDLRSAVGPMAAIWPVDALNAGPLDTLAGALAALSENLPARWDDGSLIRPGTDPLLDADRALLTGQREALAELESRERERSGIRTVKVGFHRSFGYYLEVSRKDAASVPADWHRRQTMTNTERFTSAALRELEAEILTAEERIRQREQEHIRDLMERVTAAMGELTDLAFCLAEADVLAALAEAAVRYRYRAPEWDEGEAPGIVAAELRHPVLETLEPDYVASPLTLSPPARVAIITGPNMGGKSTFMRAVALNVLMAHVGGMVAADRLVLPVLDGVFTRIGADDDLFRGQSTFMVEMEEMAWILKQATPHSLVVLDELGRGTSTFDGLAIASAVLEELARPDGPFTLFATHYHELTEMPAAQSRIVNLTVEVVEDPAHRLVFSHRVTPGQASRSYGVDVAALAGLPPEVLRRAREHLLEWEQRRPEPSRPVQQATQFAPDPLANALRAALAALNPDDLSPREAWQWLARWHERLGEENLP